MLGELVGSLPGWLVAGVALGGGLAFLAAAVFAVGVRFLPPGTTGAPGREGGERRRRAEIRRYLADIGEPYREDHVVAGRRTAFYLPERDVAITFDARDYFRLEGAGVTAVLLEYELPGDRLGARLPFETPRETSHEDATVEDGGAAGTERPGFGPEEAAYETLGLSADASESDVRAAYRERVKAVHPDHGGDVEAFRRLREAYTVARRRAD